ncbi:MAG TPA: SDR family oxidoreductase [Solirubrobacteraceae bacterium]
MSSADQMRGKVCLVTGATSGLGRATAVALASAGADVLIVGRDRQRGDAVRSELAEVDAATRSELLLCDLASQRQVRELAATLCKRLNRLDVLVNNAGVDVGKRQQTEDGFELTFAVNHLAAFTLTLLLAEALKASREGRVVTVTSGAHNAGKIVFDDLQGERRFSGQRAYNQSKLANVLFTLELARRLEGTHVAANCVDPGWVKGTGLGRTASIGLKALALIMWPTMVSPERGADTIVWAATAPELAGQSGKLFKKRKAIEPASGALEVETARRLWEESARLTGVSLG